MDGVGGADKIVVKDTISYYPNTITTNKEQLIQHLHTMENIIIESCDQNDVEKVKMFYSCDKVNSLKIKSKGCSISKVQEIYCDTVNNKKREWKPLSRNTEYTKAQWGTGKKVFNG